MLASSCSVSYSIDLQNNVPRALEILSLNSLEPSVHLFAVFLLQFQVVKSLKTFSFSSYSNSLGFLVCGLDSVSLEFASGCLFLQWNLSSSFNLELGGKEGNICDMTTRSWMEVLPPATVPCYPSSSWLIGEKMSGGGIGAGNWTPEENKRFEYALAKFDKDTPDRWEQVAASIPGKTAWDVESHYRDLLDDVSDIEAGRIPCPGYDSSSFTLDWETNYGFEASTQPYCIGGKRSAARASDQERKKGVPWTEDEHK